MPIQFRCESCGQPIEVDDDGASQWVSCPFCSKTSRAPAISDTNLQFDVPVAPPRDGFEPEAVGVESAQPPVAGSRDCKLGWVSLACLGVCLVSTCVLMSAVYSALPSFGASADFAANQKIVMEHQAAHPWTILPNCLSTMAAIAALPLAIVSLVRRESPRWPAIVTLAVSSVMVGLMCLGAFMSMATASGI